MAQVVFAIVHLPDENGSPVRKIIPEANPSVSPDDPVPVFPLTIPNDPVPDFPLTIPDHPAPANPLTIPDDPEPEERTKFGRVWKTRQRTEILK
ncbi:hypothetical protein TNCV_2664761 [Trichonephila clavipes]|nr:hypothetical protein TNCV_2664761 [Trichonephila clavipes]